MSSGPWQEPPGNTWRLNRGFGQDHQACGRILLCRALPSAPFTGCHTDCWQLTVHAGLVAVMLGEGE